MALFHGGPACFVNGSYGHVLVWSGVVWYDMSKDPSFFMGRCSQAVLLQGVVDRVPHGTLD